MEDLRSELYDVRSNFKKMDSENQRLKGKIRYSYNEGDYYHDNQQYGGQQHNYRDKSFDGVLEDQEGYRPQKNRLQELKMKTQMGAGSKLQ